MGLARSGVGIQQGSMPGSSGGEGAFQNADRKGFVAFDESCFCEIGASPETDVHPLQRGGNGGIGYPLADPPAAGPGYLEGHRPFRLRHPSQPKLPRGEHCQDFVYSVEHEISRERRDRQP